MGTKSLLCKSVKMVLSAFLVLAHFAQMASFVKYMFCKFPTIPTVNI